MELSRVKDYLLNNNGIDFNYYGQRGYVEPPMDDVTILYNYLLYVAIKYYNLDPNNYFKNKIYNEFIPQDFLKDCNSFEEANVLINNLRDVLGKQKHYNEFDRIEETYLTAFERTLQFMAAVNTGGGKKFFSRVLKKEQSKADIRIYIPCNSEYTYRFSRLLIEKSIQYGLDFNFKIMNVENEQNGADNIVMYLQNDNIEETINMINEIVEENPDITFGKPHMFGYEVNPYIAVTPELKDSSYSQRIRNYIEESIRYDGVTKLCAEHIYEDVEDLLNRRVVPYIPDNLVGKKSK